MKKILYIDSSESHRMLLQEVLSEEGYEVFTASSIEEALSQFRGIEADLLILELRQENAKGKNIQKIRKQYPDIPWVGYSTFAQCPREFSEWLDFYLTKSSETGEIKNLIKALWDLKQICGEWSGK